MMMMMKKNIQVILTLFTFILPLSLPLFPPPPPTLQPGRFSQVLVLQQSPSGGFYLRADIQRFGVGALAHNLGE
jgi:hypothetical protein